MDENDTERRSVRVALPKVQREWLAKQANEGAKIREALWLLMATEAKIEEERAATYKSFICGGCGHSVVATIGNDRIFTCPGCGYTSQIGTH